MYQGDTRAAVLALRHDAPAPWSPAATGARPAREGRARVPAADAIVMAAASAVVALVVFLCGEAIGSTALPQVTHLPTATAEIDPRDSVVANGPVTPWMERAARSAPPLNP